MPKQPLSVGPGKKIRLADFSPRHTGGATKRKALAKTAEHLQSIAELGYRLYAENRRSVLVILQGTDAAGKDGTVRHVMEGLNPQSCVVATFKKPTDIELAHDFLWRVHSQVPRAGNVGVFNRSHYEDVVTARVHQLVPKKVWQARFDAINNFEQHLTDSGVTILKFFLHISQQEQQRRLQERLDDPSKRWKFTPADVEERKFWDDYQQAYQDALTRCNTQCAPWHIVPADRKWYRNLVVSRVLHDTLAQLDPQYPPPQPGIEGMIVT